MGEIHKFKTQVDKDRETVVEIVNFIQERVKEGEIEAIGIAVVTSDGKINACFSETYKGPQLLAAATLLQHDLVDNMNGNADDGEE